MSRAQALGLGEAVVPLAANRSCLAPSGSASAPCAVRWTSLHEEEEAQWEANVVCRGAWAGDCCCDRSSDLTANARWVGVSYPGSQ